MQRKLLRYLKWISDHHSILAAGGFALIGIINLWRWKRDQAAAYRLRSQNTNLPNFKRHPKVSFLIPAWNEAAHIRPCLKSILNLRYPKKQLIICAGGEDGTLEIAKTFTDTDVIVLPQMPSDGKQKALERCFEHATGELIFLTDADCILSDACFERTIAPLIMEGEQIATGYWQPFKEEKRNFLVRYQWAVHLRYQAGLGQWVENLDGRNCALTREALIAAGSFKNPAAIGTDFVLSRKLKKRGYPIRSVLESHVETEYPKTLRNYIRQGSRWYRNRLVQGWKYRQWRDVLGSLWAGLASLFVFTGYISFFFQWTGIAVLWLFCMINMWLSQIRLVAFLHLNGEDRQNRRKMTLNFFFANMVNNIAMIKGLMESLRPESRNYW